MPTVIFLKAPLGLCGSDRAGFTYVATAILDELPRLRRVLPLNPDRSRSDGTPSVVTDSHLPSCKQAPLASHLVKAPTILFPRYPEFPQAPRPMVTRKSFGSGAGPPAVFGMKLSYTRLLLLGYDHSATPVHETRVATILQRF
ncbi:MAG: hypothetical protein JWQ89_4516 [Devosia sp.]|nr:hypothetical protein [Devosia sp.]